MGEDVKGTDRKSSESGSGKRRERTKKPVGQSEGITPNVEPGTEASGDSRPARPGGSGGTNGGNGKPTGTGEKDGGKGTGQPDKSVPKMVPVIVPPVSSEDGKKKRGRPSKQDQIQKTAQDTTQLIKAVYGVASFLLGPHWALSDDEAKAIGEPLGRILARNLPQSKVAEMSDPIALLLSLAVVTVPRVMITIEQKGRASRGTNQRTETPGHGSGREGTSGTGSNTNAGGNVVGSGGTSPKAVLPPLDG